MLALRASRRFGCDNHPQAAPVDFDWVAERARIDREEYQAYHQQKRNDVRLGGGLEVHLTVDYAGRPLPREHAIEHIVAATRRA